MAAATATEIKNVYVYSNNVCTKLKMVFLIDLRRNITNNNFKKKKK